MGVSLKSPHTMIQGCGEAVISCAIVSACGARMADASANLRMSRRIPLFTFSFSGDFSMFSYTALSALVNLLDSK